MRSLTLPPGLRCSHLASTGTPRPAAIGPSGTSGVLPISPRTAASGALSGVHLEVELEELLDLRDPPLLDERLMSGCAL